MVVTKFTTRMFGTVFGNNMLYNIALAAVISLVASQTVVDVINGRKELSTLASALKSAGLDGVLSDKSQNFTIFAPNNTAFDDVTVPNQIAVLQNLLEYHVVSGYILSTDLSAG